MKNGQTVAAFEREFAQYVGAKYAIALCNGTATLHTALVALGVKPGDKVATTPLTMSATSIAILQVGAVPVYCDVDEKTWLMTDGWRVGYTVAVSLYGLHYPTNVRRFNGESVLIDDAAQTLRRRDSRFAFTSYSFQASKILALGEGGMLVTDSEELATKAREFSSLGYRMKADQPRINSALIRNPNYERHHSMGWNYRMNDLTAAEGRRKLGHVTILKEYRTESAEMYREAFAGCDWSTPQYVPEGWTHDYWTYAIALESKELWKPFTEAIVRHGGEVPYGAWRLTYQEPAFRSLVRFPTTDRPYDHHSVTSTGVCPIAESLQPRLVQMQTNNLESAEKNARAVKKAIEDINNARATVSVLRDVSPMQPGTKLEWTNCPGATGTPCS